MITSVEQADPNWLTDVLRQGGFLTEGAVAAVTVRPNAAFNSTVAHLTLTYASGTITTAPSALLLKLNHDEDGAHEVGFYRLMMSEGRPLSVIVGCYGTQYEPDSGDSFCLLQDVSATHIEVPVTRQQILALNGVPPDTYCDQMIVGLARLHAYWWEHPRLGGESGVTAVRWWYGNRTLYGQHIQKRADELARFGQTCRDEIPARLFELYETTLAGLPRLWETYLEPRVTRLKNLTITNSDCYFNQFLCDPHPSGQAVIVDFQDASANFGAFDLVFLLAAFWTSAQRHDQNREERLLRLYLQTLHANGVREYGWDDLETDYRVMIAIIMFMPVWDQTNGSSKSYWWPKMQCLTAAFDDWRCAELFGG